MAHDAFNWLRDRSQALSGNDEEEEIPVSQFFSCYPQTCIFHEKMRELAGTVSFETALQIRGWTRIKAVAPIHQWNTLSVWRDQYQITGLLMFAQNIFGDQFGLTSDGKVVCLDLETGGIESAADSLESWIAQLVDHWQDITGYRAAHDWQVMNGSLKVGDRLIPSQPFVLGGTSSVRNLFPMPETRMLDWYVNIYHKIRDLPDGERVVLRKS